MNPLYSPLEWAMGLPTQIDLTNLTFGWSEFMGKNLSVVSSPSPAPSTSPSSVSPQLPHTDKLSSVVVRSLINTSGQDSRARAATLCTQLSERFRLNLHGSHEDELAYLIDTGAEYFVIEQAVARWYSTLIR
jgi:hypothetical protein